MKSECTSRVKYTREKLLFWILKLPRMAADGSIQTDVFRKPTSTNSFLEWQSHHPPALKRGIPIGQYLRACQNCSNEETFEKEASNLYKRFIDRGYPKKFLKRAYWRAKHSKRDDLLSENKVAFTENKKIVRCIGTYDSYNQEIITILRRYWPILLADRDLGEVLNEYPALTYRRGQNLREHLVHSLYQEGIKETWLRSTIKGSFPCGNCKFCTYLPRIKEFKIPGTERKIEIRQFFNCRLKGIVYVATCTCPKLYVGKTLQEFRRRISKHISAINCGEETPIARHLREYHNNDVKALKFWGLSQQKRGKRKGNLDRLLLREEAKWIFRLNTLNPNGFNEGFTFTPFI